MDEMRTFFLVEGVLEKAALYVDEIMGRKYGVCLW